MIKTVLKTLILFLTISFQAHAFNICGDQLPLPGVNIDYLDSLQSDLGKLARGIETHGKCNPFSTVFNNQRMSSSPLYSIDLPTSNPELIKLVKGFASLLIINDNADQYLQKSLDDSTQRVCLRFKGDYFKPGIKLLEELLENSKIQINETDLESCL